jgi:hypothetical protein
LVPGIIGALIIGFLLFHRNPRARPATAVTTSSAAAPESAAGKPCIAPTDPLPAGAPPVPVEVGPPPTELVVKDLKPGTGATVKGTGSVTVNYVGVACSTGKTFATSYPNGTVTIPFDAVIAGEEAYGADGAPPGAGPDEPVWLVIEVTDAVP